MKLSLQDLNLRGKKVLMRVDFNVPMDNHGNIVDDTRIRLALPTIEYILNQGAGLILMSHFGNPKGKPDPKLTLKPCAKHLEKLLNKKVEFIQAYEKAKNLNMGEIILLENLRFHVGEEDPQKDPSFVKNLATLGDIYVNDAFGAAHRKHASITTITEYFPNKCLVGFLMEKEIFHLSKMMLQPKHPFFAILGGAKVSSKIEALHSLVQKIDAVFVGGGMAFTFLKVMGFDIGDSICDDKMLKDADIFLKKCREQSIDVFLPEDVIITNGEENKTILVESGIPPKWKGMDIGPKTVNTWKVHLEKANTIFWNGPMGVYEIPAFSDGTNKLAQNLSTVPGDVIIGGGDSVAAINSLGIKKNFTHISTGGGASLEYIEHGNLPGIEAIPNK